MLQYGISVFFQGIEMAKLFESYTGRDPKFEIPAEPHLGLVVFNLKVSINSYILLNKCSSFVSSFA